MGQNPLKVLVGPDGQPLKTRATTNCPRCGSGPDKQVQSSGFGTPHPVCNGCGFEEFEKVMYG